MPGAGRLGDKAQGTSDAHGCPGCPHPVVGPAIAGSPNVNINGLPALRVDDQGIHAACCGTNMWQAAQGSETVFVNGKPAMRQNDPTRHCGGQGKLIEGSADVIVGGASSSGGGGASSSASGGGAAASSSGGGGGGKVAGDKQTAPVKLPPITLEASVASSGQSTTDENEKKIHEQLKPDHLRKCDTDDETEFKKRVYKKHEQRASRARQFCAGVPDNELVLVEHGQRMKRDAANAAIKLMKELRADLASQKAAGDAHAQRVSDVKISSGYRDPVHDRDVWDDKYDQYYKETAKDRDATGNKHGDESAEILAKYIAQYKACPGYSNHTNGLAFDIVTTEKDGAGKSVYFTTNHHQNHAWESTWVYQWLDRGARKYGFRRIPTEAWHWEYHS